MPTLKVNNLSKTYKKEYFTWREDKDFQAAKLYKK